MVFESGILPEDWIAAVNVPLYKDAGILGDRACRMTEGLIDVISKSVSEQGRGL